MTYLQNFNALVKQLDASSPSERASEFLAKIANQIREKGEDWISANCVELQILDDNSAPYFPVNENRLFHITNFQTALRLRK